MEQAALFYCHDCKGKKPKDQFKLHLKDNKYGKKDDPTTRCLPCAEKERQRRQNKKRKRDEEGINSSESLATPDPIISIENFTELLRELAREPDIDWRTCVSTRGMVGEEDDILKLILRRVWDATGFRFTYGWFLLGV